MSFSNWGDFQFISYFLALVIPFWGFRWQKRTSGTNIVEPNTFIVRETQLLLQQRLLKMRNLLFSWSMMIYWPVKLGGRYPSLPHFRLGFYIGKIQDLLGNCFLKHFSLKQKTIFQLQKQIWQILDLKQFFFENLLLKNMVKRKFSVCSVKFSEEWLEIQRIGLVPSPRVRKEYCFPKCSEKCCYIFFSLYFWYLITLF